MNPPKVDKKDYIQFLIATKQAYTATEAARTHTERQEGILVIDDTTLDKSPMRKT